MDNEQPHQELVKCVVVGDTAVGKTRLICARACNKQVSLSQLINTHIPTVWAIDQYRIYKEVLERSWEIVDGVNVSLRLWDTFGDHDKDRRFAYGRSDVVLLCFSIANPISLRNCKVMWYPEIRKFCPRTPIVLVGCKNDLRYMYMDETFISCCKDRSPFFRPVRECDILSPEQGRSVARDIGAAYYETSVLNYYGVNEVFENVIRASLIERRRQRFWMTNLKKVQRPLLQVPFCPPQPTAPDIQIPPSKWEQNLRDLYKNAAYTDVEFRVRGDSISGHKFLLAIASPVLERIFLMDLSGDLASTARSSSDSSMVSNTLDDTCVGNFNPDTEQLIQDDSSSCQSWEQSPKLGPFVKTSSESKTDSTLRENGTIYKDLDHPAFRSIEIRQGLSNHGTFQTVVTVSPVISPSAMQHCLQFLYTGNLDVKSCNLIEVGEAASLMQLEELQLFIANILNGEEFLNNALKQNFIQNVRTRLKDLCLTRGLFSDVLFQLEDGTCSAHRPLLMCRCDMMCAMFSGDFRESSAKVVQFPGVRQDIFRRLLYYLYTDECPSVKPSECIEVIELANRTCLTHLLALVESHVVNDLKKKNGTDVTEDALHLLEPCQLHNANQLADWCVNYIAVNYNNICKQTPKLLRNLHPENQAYLNRHRWPPVWYLKEYDYFERCVTEREREEQPLKAFKRHRNGSGCLCFASKSRRNGDKLNYCSVGVDLQTINTKFIRLQLEARYSIDLTERKKRNQRNKNGAQRYYNENSESDDEYDPGSKRGKGQKAGKAKRTKEDESAEDDVTAARQMHQDEMARQAKQQVPPNNMSQPPAAGTTTGKRKGVGYTREYTLSGPLAEIVGAKQMPRHEVVKKIWEIVKTRDLRDPKDKRFTICDAQLLTVFGVKRFNTFSMMKYLKHHFLEPQ
ncbi:hypothetical protein CHUAL_009203 [Chamberlinius hualienensis]